MLAALRQAGMSPPRFADRIGTFQVTFPNHTLLDGDTLGWLESAGGLDLTDSQRMALALLRRGEPVTNASYRRISGLDSRVATRELGDLVQQGLLKQEGTGRWTTYRLAAESLAEAPARPTNRHRRAPPEERHPFTRRDRERAQRVGRDRLPLAGTASCRPHRRAHDPESAAPESPLPACFRRSVTCFAAGFVMTKLPGAPPLRFLAASSEASSQASSRALQLLS
jgi:hypothetical protein